MKKRTLAHLAGGIWLGVGSGLMMLGMHFLKDVLRAPMSVYDRHIFSFISCFSSTPPTTVVIWILALALAVGYMKGRWVLSRSVSRQIDRLQGLVTPPTLRHVYSKGYYFLMASMIGLGVCMRFLPIALDVRGAIDVAIGTALIQGARHYFRRAQALA